MTEPRRMLEDAKGASRLEKELLRAAREDAPSGATQASVMAALGIASGLAAATQASAASAAIQTATAQGAGAATTGTATTGAATTGAATAGAATVGATATGAATTVTTGATAAGAATAITTGAATTGAASTGATAAGAALSLGKGVVLVKWVGIASVGVVGSAAVIDHTSEPEREPTTTTAMVAPSHASERPAHPARIVEARPKAAPETTEGAQEDPEAEEPKPTAEQAAEKSPEAEEPKPTVAQSPARKRRQAKAPLKPSPKPQLSAEVAMLDEAQRALRAGNGEAADRALTQYQTKFGKGRLASEAQVLQIEALALKGNKAAAHARAQAFLAANPNSPYASRLRALTASE